MSDVFGSVYASIYDDLYNDKDYNAECNLIQRIFEQYGSNHIKTILDLGCGTGNHALPLAEQGFEVTGVDCSQEMINKAQSKNTPCTFYLGDIRQFNANRKSDAVLMMFAVLGYQLENADVLAALKTARCHLNPGGLLIFDVWYGPAVLAQRPTDKVKIISTKSKKIIRAASGDLDIRRQICTVRYHIWQLNDNMLTAETQEEHQMRFFFPKELEFLVQTAGFKLIRLGSFPDYENSPSDNTWNVIAICKAE